MDRVGTRPGGLLGGAEDRAERDAEARRPTVAGGGGADPLDHRFCVGEGLAPDHVGLGVLRADLDRGIGGAAEEDRDVRLLPGADVGVGALEAVVGAVVVDGRVRGPDLLQDLQVLVGAAVPLVVGEVVAVLRLVDVAAAGDDVECQPTSGELIEGGELAGGDGRGDEAGPVGQQDAEPLGAGGGVRGDEEAVRGVREVADEDPIEAAALVGLREVADVVVIEDRETRRDDLRLSAVRDHAKEVDRHRRILSRSQESGVRSRCRGGFSGFDTFD